MNSSLSSLDGADYPSEKNANPATSKRARSRTLSRTRSVGLRTFDSSRVPPLPRLNGDITLQVFTHKSLRRPDVSPAEYGDNEGLSDFGRIVFELGVTHALFNRRPMLRAPAIAKYREHLLASTMVEDWMSVYNLVPKLRCQRDVVSSIKSPQEVMVLFLAYVGGMYMTSGPQAVNTWISALLEQELEALQNDIGMDVDTPSSSTPPPKRVKSEFMSPPPGPFFYPQAPPMPVPRPPPPHQAFPPAIPPNPLAPAQPTLPFLPLFNQAAMQRRVTVEYYAEFSGPSHAGRWAVKCIVNGICKGEGSGNSKQIAKEEAARKAYYSMGWT